MQTDASLAIHGEIGRKGKQALRVREVRAFSLAIRLELLACKIEEVATARAMVGSINLQETGRKKATDGRATFLNCYGQYLIRQTNLIYWSFF